MIALIQRVSEAGVSIDGATVASISRGMLALVDIEQHSPPVQSGIFGADMQVSLVNDGPVTFLLETR